MKRSLIYFAALYGEATSAVVMIALVVYWVAQPSGIATCEKVGLSPVACGTTLSLIILLLTGLATIQIFKKLRQDVSQENSDGKAGES